MKTRIKVIERNDLSKEYIPQFKNTSKTEWWLSFSIPFIGWMNAIDLIFLGGGWETFIDTNNNNPYWCVAFDNLKSAQEFIDSEWQKYEAQKTQDYNKKVKSITKIKYP